MKYALVLNDDPLLYLGVLHRTLQQVEPRPACIVTVPGIPNPLRKRQYMRAALKIFGASYAAKMAWRYLRAPFWTLGQVARHHEVPYFRHASVNAHEFRECLQAQGITTVFSVTAEIYKRETLALPGVGFYNFHGSLLPAHKGLLPLFWAFMSGAPQGVTVHAINEQIDEGPIVFQERLECGTADALPAITDILLDRFPSHLARAIRHVELGLAPALLNDGIVESYEPIPSEEDIRAYFQKLGRR